MNAQRSARWVRRWVALYTRGLPADVRRDRGDEIESDLWCQMADASESEEGVGAIGNEILARLLLGIPADIRWRFEQSSGAPTPVPVVGKPTLYARNVAISAAIGGVAWAIWLVPAILLREAAWVGMPGVFMMICLLVGAFGLSLATAGLVFGNIDRLHGIVSMLGAVGAAVGLLLAGGVFLGIVVLPLGSAAVMWNLARLGIVRSRLAWIHAGSGVALAVGVMVVLSSNLGVGYLMIMVGLELYALSWAVIGWSLRAGTWMPEEPARST